MNTNIFQTALGNGIDVHHVDVESGTVTTFSALKNLNGTAFEDTIAVAKEIVTATYGPNASGGATFYDGGDGFKVYEGDGYAVGGYLDTVTAYTGPGSYLNHKDVVNLIAKFIESIPYVIPGPTSLPRHKYAVGTWVEDNTLHIDAVEIWADLGNAIVEGQRLNQYSIYGFNESCEYVCADHEVIDGEVYNLGTCITCLEPIDQLAVEVDTDLVNVDDVVETDLVLLDAIIAEVRKIGDSYKRLQDGFAQYAREAEYDSHEYRGDVANRDVFAAKHRASKEIVRNLEKLFSK